MNRDALYAIVGPTAVGKTKAAFELAGAVGGEIISVDSRQVYRYLDVGTDKISAQERRIIAHHLIDVADPDEVFTVADFVKYASDSVRRIHNRGKIPILAGGTPLYYKALEGNMLSDMLPKDDNIRGALGDEAARNGLDSLYDELKAADPDSAARIHRNDQFRITRALELYRITGRSATSIYAEGKKIGGDTQIFYFGITSPRENLYRKIEKRVEEQFHSGYIEEVEWLIRNGYSRELPALKGFGYREIAAYLMGEMSFDDAMNGDVRSTKAFSRRQMTWFRQFSPIVWYDFTEISLSEAVRNMADIISRSTPR
ncbi:MAG: tRNA (adenosine(37)-N6)-dimethylallyltransferase MiaA [Synergistaceae bacterium]|jgi:tRNA dimethylallyltransferase|nr:tRNA (adenosine(37)-N6)-dimethylallyltransferase MiaA [Synergistaceae bacterium]